MPILNSAKFDTDALDYAEHLIEQCRDTAWEEDMRQHRDTAATQNAVDKFAALFEKGLNDQQRQYLLELGEQMFDPTNILRGHMADALRDNALALLPKATRFGRAHAGLFTAKSAAQWICGEIAARETRHRAGLEYALVQHARGENRRSLHRVVIQNL